MAHNPKLQRRLRACFERHNLTIVEERETTTHHWLVRAQASSGEAGSITFSLRGDDPRAVRNAEADIRRLAKTTGE